MGMNRGEDNSWLSSLLSGEVKKEESEESENQVTEAAWKDCETPAVDGDSQPNCHPVPQENAWGVETDLEAPHAGHKRREGDKKER